MNRFFATLIVMLASSISFADGYLSLSPGQTMTVNYQTLATYGGSVQVSCGGSYNPPPPPPPRRNCGFYRWTYVNNQYNTSVTTCLANGVPVGAQKDCHVANTCGNQAAIEFDCRQRCESGEFDGLLPRGGGWR